MIPNHVGIIVDGNGRWATSRGKKRSEGHKAGADNLIKICKHAFKKNVKILSLYVFSTENFKRSNEEVNYLMDLFVKMFEKEFNKLDNIKIIFSGRKENLNNNVLKIMEKVKNDTKNNTGGVINFCLNYGSKYEILDAIKKMNLEDIKNLTVDNFNKYLYNELPDIDLLIRTGKEKRISNFMLWQLAYAELYFSDTLFPDFNNLELDKALEEYNNRDRRYGGIVYEEKNN